MYGEYEAGSAEYGGMLVVSDGEIQVGGVCVAFRITGYVCKFEIRECD